MSKSRGLLFLSSFILVSCGNGSSDAPVATPYGYGQNQSCWGTLSRDTAILAPQGRPNDRLCPARVVRDWVGLVASSCENVCGASQEPARRCVFGAREFQNRYPGIQCDIPVQEGRWYPGTWQQQAYFTINDPVIQSIYDKYGWAGNPSFPVSPNPGPFPRR